MDFKLGTHNGRLLHWPNYSCVSRKTKLWQLLLQPAVCMPSLIVQWSPEFATFSHCVRCETGLYIVMLKGDVLASEAWLPKHFTITRKPSVGKQSQSFCVQRLGRKESQARPCSFTHLRLCLSYNTKAKPTIHRSTNSRRKKIRQATWARLNWNRNKTAKCPCYSNTVYVKRVSTAIHANPVIEVRLSRTRMTVFLLQRTS